MFTPFASASLVFLILYAFLLGYMVVRFARRQFRFRSSWTVLLSHSSLRICAQACGLVLGLQGLRRVDMLIATLVLGAEGYFTLVLSTLNLLHAWHVRHTPRPDGTSWLEKPKSTDQGLTRKERLRNGLSGLRHGKGLFNSPMEIIHLPYFKKP